MLLTSWEGMESMRLYASYGAMAVILLVYLWLVAIDFKHKEMEYWKILLASIVNIVLIYTVASFYGESLYGYMAIVLVTFVVLSFLNGLLNKENVVGQADVDVFISQLLITISVAHIISQSFTEQMAVTLNVVYMIQVVTSSVFTGLLATIIIFLLTVVVYKIRKKKTFKESISDNKGVPTLIAFIPWIYVNIVMILGL